MIPFICLFPAPTCTHVFVHPLLYRSERPKFTPLTLCLSLGLLICTAGLSTAQCPLRLNTTANFIDPINEPSLWNESESQTFFVLFVPTEYEAIGRD